MTIKPLSLVILLIACGVLAASGAGLWLVLALAIAWAGTLMLAGQEADLPARPDRSDSARHEAFADVIERLNTPLMLLERERVVAANAPARAAFGQHVQGQDVRIALRHPDAIALLDQEGEASAVVPRLTGPRTVWDLQLFPAGGKLRLLELVDRTAEADISRAHTDFVANASHELRTPLASIIGYVETLSEADTKLKAADRTRFLGTIGREASRMETLIADLMSLSRIEAEKHDQPGELIDLASVVASVAKDLSASHGTDRIYLNADADVAKIKGDRGQIEQLIRNLVDNAVKYGDASLPVEIALTQRPSGPVLQVSDKGPGIPAAHLPHVTRRFYRTDPGRSRAAGGTGLGLAIVKHIAERHRAQLDIHSIEGQGTQVSLAFPSAQADMS